MQKSLLNALLLLLCGMYAFAQDRPKAEVFAGYSYLKLDVDAGNSGGDNSVPGGFNVDGTYYFVHGLGATADFQYHKKSFTNDPLEGTADARAISLHFGPRFKAHAGRLEPFVHALFGFTNLHVSGAFPTLSDSAFSMKLGGGVDVAASRHFAIRLGEANYYMTKFSTLSDVNFNNNADPRQNNFTFSAGIVIR